MRFLLLASLLAVPLAANAGAWLLDAIPETQVWQVFEIDGTPVPEGVEITLTRLKEGLLGGNAGCNRFSLRIGESDGRLFPGDFITTKMMCQPAVMKVEWRFGRALERVTGLATAGDTLGLSDAGGRVVIRARK